MTKLPQAARFLRWLAVSQFPALHAISSRTGRIGLNIPCTPTFGKPWKTRCCGTSRALFMSMSVKHLSLPFDGFRDRSREPWARRRYVLDRTGLPVGRAKKEHLSWLEGVMRHEVVDEVVDLFDADAHFWSHPACTVLLCVIKTPWDGRGIFFVVL